MVHFNVGSIFMYFLLHSFVLSFIGFHMFALHIHFKYKLKNRKFNFFFFIWKWWKDCLYDKHKQKSAWYMHLDTLIHVNRTQYCNRKNWFSTKIFHIFLIKHLDAGRLRVFFFFRKQLQYVIKIMHAKYYIRSKMRCINKRLNGTSNDINVELKRSTKHFESNTMPVISSSPSLSIAMCQRIILFIHFHS